MKIITIIYLLAISLSVAANQSGQDCQVVNWFPDKSYKLYSSKANGLHIQMPEIIVDNPVSNNAVWVQTTANNVQSKHLFIRPNASENDVKTGGLTLIGQSGTAYNFIVVNKKEAINCAVVKRGNQYGNRSISQVNHSVQQNKEFDLINEQLKKMERTIALNKQVSDKVASYQDSLTSPYKFDSEKISSVHDDGRFTFIMLAGIKPGNSKYVAIGEIDGVEYAIDYKYEKNTNKIKIAGLFDKLILIKNKEKIEIHRQG